MCLLSLVTIMGTAMMASLLGDWKITVKGPVEKQVKRLCHKHTVKSYPKIFLLRLCYDLLFLIKFNINSLKLHDLNTFCQDSGFYHQKKYDFSQIPKGYIYATCVLTQGLQA